MAGHHLAQLNVARSLAPIGSPTVADFVAALAPINRLAESSPGFVWRLQTEAGDATSIQAFDDPLIILNLSVWESIETLSDFVLRTAHRDVLRRRREWFARMAEAHVVLRWIPAGMIPTVAEALARLDQVRRFGPTNRAFSFRVPFGPPEHVVEWAAAD